VLDQAELRRVDPKTFQVDVRAFSIRRAWSGEDDVALQPLDAVTVFSSARFPRSISIEGQVTRPGTYTLSPGERLSNVLRRAARDARWPPAGAIFCPSAARRERSFLREFVQRQRVDLARSRFSCRDPGTARR